MTASKLSPTMKACIAYANQHGGKLTRYPGGFWCKDGLMEGQRPWFNTTTIEALVARGEAVYTAWKDRLNNGPFPIEVTMKGESDASN